MNRLFILSDSASMSVGVDKKSYPFILADLKNWSDETEIINPSQPGFTACDACAFFFRHIKNYPDLKAIIIYLGNCDANATEFRKGRYTALRHYRYKAAEVIGFKKRRPALKNRLLRFKWNDRYDANIENPEEPSDYEFNLRRIINYCNDRSIPVLLIRPKANLLFPAGLGKGNFIFYKYFGLREKLLTDIMIPDKHFMDVLKLHEEKDYSAALKLYKKLIEVSGGLLLSPEYAFMIKNNYAVCAAETGKLAQAKKALEDLLKKRYFRKEIVLFNLAQIYKAEGNIERYLSFLKNAYELDSSIYRIRDPYLEVIDRIVSKFPYNLRLIDMSIFAKQDFFIDHCHLNPEGQRLLAREITKGLTELNLIGGNESAHIKNMLYNPELAFGYTAEFYSYYKAYSSLKGDQIKKEFDKIREASFGNGEAQSLEVMLESVSKEMGEAIRNYLKHPCFPSIYDLLDFPPSHPSDIGRFSEFFLIRHIVPYLRILEKEVSLRNIFSKAQGLLHSSADFVSILPQPVTALISADDPHINSVSQLKRLDAILAKVERDLLVHLRMANQIHKRIKTTIFWYFREALRWGSHSRISMRYDRLFLENCAEALAICGVLNLKLNSTKNEIILKKIAWIEEADRIHSNFAEQFSFEKDCEELLREYDNALLELAHRIENSNMPIKVGV